MVRCTPNHSPSGGAPGTPPHPREGPRILCRFVAFACIFLRFHNICSYCCSNTSCHAFLLACSIALFISTCLHASFLTDLLQTNAFLDGILTQVEQSENRVAGFKLHVFVHELLKKIEQSENGAADVQINACLLYTSPSPRDS